MVLRKLLVLDRHLRKLTLETKMQPRLYSRSTRKSLVSSISQPARLQVRVYRNHCFTIATISFRSSICSSLCRSTMSRVSSSQVRALFTDSQSLRTCLLQSWLLIRRLPLPMETPRRLTSRLSMTIYIAAQTSRVSCSDTSTLSAHIPQHSLVSCQTVFQTTSFLS